MSKLFRMLMVVLFALSVALPAFAQATEKVEAAGTVEPAAEPAVSADSTTVAAPEETDDGGPTLDYDSD